MRSPANERSGRLESPHTVVHCATVLEEMPVQGTVVVIGDLRTAGMRIGGVGVNQVREAILTRKALTAAARSRISRADVAADLKRVKVHAIDEVVDGLLVEAREHAERVALERDEAKVIAELRRPTYRLPSLPEGIDVNGIRELAQTLVAPGMAWWSRSWASPP